MVWAVARLNPPPPSDAGTSPRRCQQNVTIVRSRRRPARHSRHWDPIRRPTRRMRLIMNRPPTITPPRASRPPVPPPPPAAPPRRAPKRKRRHRATWPARLGLLILAIVVGSVAVLVWRGGPSAVLRCRWAWDGLSRRRRASVSPDQAKITFTRVTRRSPRRHPHSSPPPMAAARSLPSKSRRA